MSFRRTVEDFVCEHCGAAVKGDGYTDHCPKCLWSKHVDVSPGDRAAKCGGLMEPVRVEGASPAYDLIHRCARCGHMRKNRVAPEDDRDALLSIARKSAASTPGSGARE